MKDDVIMDNLLIRTSEGALFKFDPSVPVTDFGLDLVDKYINRDPPPVGIITESSVTMVPKEYNGGWLFQNAIDMTTTGLKAGDYILLDGSFMLSHGSLALMTDPTAKLVVDGVKTGDFDFVQYVDKETASTTHLRFNMIWRVGQILKNPVVTAHSLFHVVGSIGSNIWVTTQFYYAMTRIVDHMLLYEVNPSLLEFDPWETDVSQEMTLLFSMDHDRDLSIPECSSSEDSDSDWMTLSYPVI